MDGALGLLWASSPRGNSEKPRDETQTCSVTGNWERVWSQQRAAISNPYPSNPRCGYQQLILVLAALSVKFQHELDGTLMVWGASCHQETVFKGKGVGGP